MQIQASNEGNWGASVAIVDPGAETTATPIHLEPGERVTLTLPDVHEEAGIQVGEIETFDVDEPAAESPAQEVRPEDVADGWRGQEPAPGTRRALVRDTIVECYKARLSGDEIKGAVGALDLADAIEEALLAAAPELKAGQARTGLHRPPSWTVEEVGEDRWIRVQPNYHEQLTPEAGQQIEISPAREQQPGSGAAS